LEQIFCKWLRDNGSFWKDAVFGAEMVQKRCSFGGTRIAGALTKGEKTDDRKMEGGKLRA